MSVGHDRSQWKACLICASVWNRRSRRTSGERLRFSGRHLLISLCSIVYLCSFEELQLNKESERTQLADVLARSLIDKTVSTCVELTYVSSFFPLAFFVRRHDVFFKELA